MTVASMIYLAILVIGIALIVIYSRNGRLIRSVLFTLTTGLVSLALVLVIAKFTSLPISVTPLSILVSGVLGIPGVLGMLILNLI